MIERDAAHAGTALVGDQLEVIGLAAHDAADGDEGVAVVAVGQRGERERHFERARHADVPDVLVGDAERAQLGAAGLEQRIGQLEVEARLHDADAQVVAVEPRRGLRVRALVG